MMRAKLLCQYQLINISLRIRSRKKARGKKERTKWSVSSRRVYVSEALWESVSPINTLSYPCTFSLANKDTAPVRVSLGLARKRPVINRARYRLISGRFDHTFHRSMKLSTSLLNAVDWLLRRLIFARDLSSMTSPILNPPLCFCER